MKFHSRSRKALCIVDTHCLHKHTNKRTRRRSHTKLHAITVLLLVNPTKLDRPDREYLNNFESFVRRAQMLGKLSKQIADEMML